MFRSASVYRAKPPLMLSPVVVPAELMLVTLAAANPPKTIEPPASRRASADWLNCGSEHALWPAAAIGIDTALLSSPPALTWANAKQSGVMSEGRVKLICQSPG